MSIMVTIKCPQCGKEFQTYPSRITRGKKFCTRDCYNQWLKANPPRPMVGKHHSEESKEKMRKGQQRVNRKGKNSPNYKGRWMCRGYWYITLAELTEEQKKVAEQMCPIRHAGVLEHRLVMAMYLGRPLVRRDCLLYTSPSPRDGLLSRMPSSA